MSDERLAEIRGYVADLIGNGVHGGGLGVCVRELLAEVDRTRAPAQLGSALVDALRGMAALDPDDMLVLYRDRNDGPWFCGVTRDAGALHVTDATIAFDASLLAAFPQESR